MCSSLEGIQSRLESVQVRKAASILRIREAKADGSASGGRRMGGTRIVETKKILNPHRHWIQ